MDELNPLLRLLIETTRDVLPLLAAMFAFQYLVLRRPIPKLGKVLVGIVYVIVGLTLFLAGLELSLFDLGETMVRQLTMPQLLGHAGNWTDYFWVYMFALAIGFAAAVAEPALIAVSLKAQEQSGGAYNAFSLRLVVAVGVGIGIMLGTWRIVVGLPLHWFIITGYCIVIVQTFFAPKSIVPLAFDSGGVTTSTVTVPIVAALGLELARVVPDRSALIDGFGLIAFAALFPIITVMAYAQFGQWVSQRTQSRR